jgi:hypothetical protein
MSPILHQKSGTDSRVKRKDISSPGRLPEPVIVHQLVIGVSSKSVQRIAVWTIRDSQAVDNIEKKADVGPRNSQVFGVPIRVLRVVVPIVVDQLIVRIAPKDMDAPRI